MFTTNCRRLPFVAVVLASAVLLSACTVEAGDEAAHAIAAKFAESDQSVAEAAPASDLEETATIEEVDSQEPAKVDERLAAEEAEMLARARAEAEERRRAEQEKARAAEQPRIEQERLRARQVAEEKLQREIEEQRKEAEARRLAEIAAQEEARRIAEKQRRLAEEEERRAAELRRRLEGEKEQERKAAEAKRQAEIAAQEEARRAAEARRLMALKQLEQEERLRIEQIRAIPALAAAAEEARKTRIEPQRGSEGLNREVQTPIRKTSSAPYALGGPKPPAAPDPLLGLPRSSRVTVLLVMEPGTRGIRRFRKTADPVLCVDSVCYISNGPGEPARAMTRIRALGPAVTIGTRAGYCRRSLTCVFRGVDFKHAMVVVQPVDLRVLRHDRREPRAVMVDPTCRIEGPYRLTCSRPVVAEGYKLWVVPESIAERAGPLALELVARAGLPQSPGVAHAGID